MISGHDRVALGVFGRMPEMMRAQHEASCMTFECSLQRDGHDVEDMGPTDSRHFAFPNITSVDFVLRNQVLV